MYKCNSEKQNHRICWLVGLKKAGLNPELFIIDEVSIVGWEFWEQHYISLFRSWGFDLVNMTNGGDNPPICRWNKGKKMSAASRAKMSESQKGNKNGLGKIKSAETRAKLSKAHTGNKYSVGRVLSQETKDKIGDSHKGNKYCLGRKLSDETKKKMSNKKLGIKKSDEAKRKMSEYRTGRKLSVNQVNKIIEYVKTRVRVKGRFVKHEKNTSSS